MSTDGGTALCRVHLLSNHVFPVLILGTRSSPRVDRHSGCRWFRSVHISDLMVGQGLLGIRLLLNLEQGVLPPTSRDP